MEKITLFTHPFSRGRNVVWALEECEASYETVVLPFGDAMKSPEYLAINPAGKVPALKYGDTVITGTIAIILFLAELFPEKRLIPAAGTAERGEFYRWAFFMVDFEYALMDRYFEVPVSHESTVARGYGSLASSVQQLREFIGEKSYLLGDHFTVLDLLATAWINYGINHTKVIQNEPILQAFMARQQTRPAFIRSTEINAELQKRLEQA